MRELGAVSVWTSGHVCDRRVSPRCFTQPELQPRIVFGWFWAGTGRPLHPTNSTPDREACANIRGSLEVLNLNPLITLPIASNVSHVGDRPYQVFLQPLGQHGCRHPGEVTLGTAELDKDPDLDTLGSISSGGPTGRPRTSRPCRSRTTRSR